MASGDGDCHKDPNFAVICSFLDKYGALLGLQPISYVDLQQYLEDTTSDVSRDLIDIHVRLLRRIGKSIVNSDRFEKSIIKFCHHFSEFDAWEIESYGYKHAKLETKLRILKNLLECQFDFNLKFKETINGHSAEEMRFLPIGRDREGQAYWYFLDHELNLLIYKEEQDDEAADTWTLVCRNRHELANLVNRLQETFTQEKNSTCGSKSSKESSPDKEISHVQTKADQTDVGSDVRYEKTDQTIVGSDVKYEKTEQTTVGSDVKYEKTDQTTVGSDVKYEKTDQTDVGSDVKFEKTDQTDVGSDVKYEKTDQTDVGSDVKYEKTDKERVDDDVVNQKEKTLRKCGTESVRDSSENRLGRMTEVTRNQADLGEGDTTGRLREVTRHQAESGQDETISFRVTESGAQKVEMAQEHVDKIEHVEKTGQEHMEKIEQEHVEKREQEHVEKTGQEHMEKIEQEHVEKREQEQVEKTGQEHMEKIEQEHVGKREHEHVGKTGEEHVKKTGQGNVEKIEQEHVEKIEKVYLEKIADKHVAEADKEIKLQEHKVKIDEEEKTGQEHVHITKTSQEHAAEELTKEHTVEVTQNKALVNDRITEAVKGVKEQVKKCLKVADRSSTNDTCEILKSDTANLCYMADNSRETDGAVSEDRQTDGAVNKGRRTDGAVSEDRKTDEAVGRGRQTDEAGNEAVNEDRQTNEAVSEGRQTDGAVNEDRQTEAVSEGRQTDGALSDRWTDGAFDDSQTDAAFDDTQNNGAVSEGRQTSETVNEGRQTDGAVSDRQDDRAVSEGRQTDGAASEDRQTDGKVIKDRQTDNEDTEKDETVSADREADVTTKRLLHQGSTDDALIKAGDEAQEMDAKQLKHRAGDETARVEMDISHQSSSTSTHLAVSQKSGTVNSEYKNKCRISDSQTQSSTNEAGLIVAACDVSDQSPGTATTSDANSAQSPGIATASNANSAQSQMETKAAIMFPHMSCLVQAHKECEYRCTDQQPVTNTAARLEQSKDCCPSPGPDDNCSNNNPTHCENTLHADDNCSNNNPTRCENTLHIKVHGSYDDSSCTAQPSTGPETATASLDDGPAEEKSTIGQVCDRSKLAVTNVGESKHCGDRHKTAQSKTTSEGLTKTTSEVVERIKDSVQSEGSEAKLYETSCIQQKNSSPSKDALDVSQEKCTTNSEVAAASRTQRRLKRSAPDPPSDEPFDPAPNGKRAKQVTKTQKTRSGRNAAARGRAARLANVDSDSDDSDTPLSQVRGKGRGLARGSGKPRRGTLPVKQSNKSMAVLSDDDGDEVSSGKRAKKKKAGSSSEACSDEEVTPAKKGRSQAQTTKSAAGANKKKSSAAVEEEPAGVRRSMRVRELRARKIPSEESEESSQNEDSSDDQEDDDDDDKNFLDTSFTPEEESGDEEFKPKGRNFQRQAARTSKEESEDVVNDDTPCVKCGKYNHPEMILLCDKCDAGYHTACLRPPLMLIPDGDWFCPPCEHSKLLDRLLECLQVFDTATKKKDRLVKRQERLAFVGISISNILHGDRKLTPSVKFDNPDKKAEHNVPVESEISSSVESEAEGKRMYRSERLALRQAQKRSHKEHRRMKRSSKQSKRSPDVEVVTQRTCRTRAVVSYQFKEFDQLISSAIEDDKPCRREKPPGIRRGKDMSNILGASDEEDEKIRQRDGSDAHPPPVVRKKSRRRLTKLDSDEDEDDDDDSDEFQLSQDDDSDASEAEEEEEDDDDESVTSDSGDWKPKKTWYNSKLSTQRSRRSRQKLDTDDDCYSDENISKRRSTRNSNRGRIHYSNWDSDEEDAEDSEHSWSDSDDLARRAKKKVSSRNKKNDNSNSDSSLTRKRNTLRKLIKKRRKDESESEDMGNEIKEDKKKGHKQGHKHCEDSDFILDQSGSEENSHDSPKFKKKNVLRSSDEDEEQSTTAASDDDSRAEDDVSSTSMVNVEASRVTVLVSKGDVLPLRKVKISVSKVDVLTSSTVSISPSSKFDISPISKVSDSPTSKVSVSPLSKVDVSVRKASVSMASMVNEAAVIGAQKAVSVRSKMKATVQGKKRNDEDNSAVHVTVPGKMRRISASDNGVSTQVTSTSVSDGQTHSIQDNSTTVNEEQKHSTEGTSTPVSDGQMQQGREDEQSNQTDTEKFMTKTAAGKKKTVPNFLDVNSGEESDDNIRKSAAIEPPQQQTTSVQHYQYNMAPYKLGVQTYLKSEVEPRQAADTGPMAHSSSNQAGAAARFAHTPDTAARERFQSGQASALPVRPPGGGVQQQQTYLMAQQQQHDARSYIPPSYGGTVPPTFRHPPYYGFQSSPPHNMGQHFTGHYPGNIAHNTSSPLTSLGQMARKLGPDSDLPSPVQTTTSASAEVRTSSPDHARSDSEKAAGKSGKRRPVSSRGKKSSLEQDAGSAESESRSCHPAGGYTSPGQPYTHASSGPHHGPLAYPAHRPQHGPLAYPAHGPLAYPLHGPHEILPQDRHGQVDQKLTIGPYQQNVVKQAETQHEQSPKLHGSDNSAANELSLDRRALTSVTQANNQLPPPDSNGQPSQGSSSVDAGGSHAHNVSYTGGTFYYPHYHSQQHQTAHMPQAGPGSWDYTTRCAPHVYPYSSNQQAHRPNHSPSSMRAPEVSATLAHDSGRGVKPSMGQPPEIGQKHAEPAHAHRLADGGADSSHRLADQGTDNSHRLADGGADNSHRLPDPGADSSHKFADRRADNSHKFADCGADNSHKFPDHGADNSHKFADCGADNSNRLPDGGADNSNRLSDGGADNSSRLSDGRADNSHRPLPVSECETSTNASSSSMKTAPYLSNVMSHGPGSMHPPADPRYVTPMAPHMSVHSPVDPRHAAHMPVCPPAEPHPISSSGHHVPPMGQQNSWPRASGHYPPPQHVAHWTSMGEPRQQYSMVRAYAGMAQSTFGPGPQPLVDGATMDYKPAQAEQKVFLQHSYDPRFQSPRLDTATNVSDTGYPRPAYSGQPRYWQQHDDAGHSHTEDLATEGNTASKPKRAKTNKKSSNVRGKSGSKGRGRGRGGFMIDNLLQGRAATELDDGDDDSSEMNDIVSYVTTDEYFKQQTCSRQSDTDSKH